MDKEQFYPTPEELGKRLAELIDMPQPPILEPSAGTGNLIEAMRNRPYRRYDPRWSKQDFHCVELNTDRAASLKGKGYIVVWDDFLTFNPLMPYRTIIMNPPFNNGAAHLQKALNILADGGELACILNAETIRNPYTDERKALIADLEAQEKYTVEFVQGAFDSTDVEIALIYVKKKPSAVRCATFENFKKSIIAEREQTDPTALIRHGEINVLLDCYRAEVKTALALYDEILNYNSVSIHESYNEIFKIEVNGHGKGYSGIVKAINYNYWHKLLYSEELSRLLTCETQRNYSSKLRDMEEYEFNERNILQLKADLTENLFGSIDAAIMKVWDNFTHRFSYADYSKNIHYYNGWKTNKAFKCNKRVIIPLYAFDKFWNHFTLGGKVRDELSDIEKAMNYLDNGRTEGADMADRLQEAQEIGGSWVVSKFFTIKLHKKGTAHLTFNDPELLKKFNLYCGRKLHWLPDDYGSAPYDELDDEHRAVADSFEGRDSYNETYSNRQFYLPNNVNPLMLTAGN